MKEYEKEYQKGTWKRIDKNENSSITTACMEMSISCMTD